MISPGVKARELKPAAILKLFEPHRLVGFSFDKQFFSIKQYSRRRWKRPAAQSFSGHVIETISQKY